MKNISRRDFLRFSTNALLAMAGLLGLGNIIRYLGYQYDPTPPSEFEIGPSTDYPQNTHKVLAHIPAIVIHDQKGLRAMSLMCTHLGCTVEGRNFGFECPCHSSRYDINGKVLKGPATADLKKLRVVESEDGHLHLFIS